MALGHNQTEKKMCGTPGRDDPSNNHLISYPALGPTDFQSTCQKGKQKPHFAPNDCAHFSHESL